MLILSIETSCDETSVAVVADGRIVLSNVIASQIDLHAKTGGVVPEVAAREHVLKMIPVLDEALIEAGKTFDDIDAIAVTQGPGLISSLIIGTETAQVLSFYLKKPLIPTNHIAGHLYSNWLGHEDEISFPVLVLTVSGGHNELVLMKDHYDFEVLGETRDDAAGEAFDKVARLLGLGYPGGPVISKYAENGDPGAFKFPRILLEKDSLDFSFSGLKTAVLNEIKNYAKEKNSGDAADFDEKFKADIAASFQEAVNDTLTAKTLRALEKYPEVREVHLAGGVSANRALREKLTSGLPANIRFRHPLSMSYCTDNAAMIATAAYFKYLLEPENYPSRQNITPHTDFEIFAS